ncbi:MAG: hypothetical protein ACI94Y_001690 [Maribacter sp.]|jgi:hypothetical protein
MATYSDIYSKNIKNNKFSVLKYGDLNQKVETNKSTRLLVFILILVSIVTFIFGFILNSLTK